MPNTKLDQARDLARGALDNIDGSSDAEHPMARAMHALAVALTLALDVVEESVSQLAAAAPTERQPASSTSAESPDAASVIDVPPMSAPPPGLYGTPRNDEGSSAPPAHAGIYEQRRNDDGSLAE